MKKILVITTIIVLAVFSTGCSVVPKYSQVTHFSDYRKYQEQGFTISPNSSGFVYESIGEIEMKFVDGKRDGYTNPDNLYSAGGIHYYKHTYDVMVDEMVNKAKELGANALLNFSISPASGPGYVGYIATGFAVNLK